VIFKFLRDSDAPRPPLAGRLVGMAVGVLLLSGAVYIALGVFKPGPGEFRETTNWR
jgi:hypothetical protein